MEEKAFWAALRALLAASGESLSLDPDAEIVIPIQRGYLLIPTEFAPGEVAQRARI